MIEVIIAFVIGLIFGAVFGTLIAALMVISKDKHNIEYTKSEQCVLDQSNKSHQEIKTKQCNQNS